VKEIELKYGEARKRARLNWARSEHGKELTRNYMKDYRRLPHNKEKAHEYYVKNKAHWGEITKAKERKAKNWGGIRQENEDIRRLHEEWAIKNGYRDNDNLHATNTERIINDAKK
jgi:hypothetical protein|tara:strand:+ start:36 stop:380 length:345 start_codon:yes stop_codon:yes gene_type:complete